MPQETKTITVAIAVPFDDIVAYLADPANHPEWATEFFAGPSRPDPDDAAAVLVPVPAFGGDARMKVVSAPDGVLDIYLTPAGAPFGASTPVRVLPNRDSVDVL